MMSKLVTKRRVLVVLLGLAVGLAVFLGVKWKAVSDHGGQSPVEPFRIAGNLYYASGGAKDPTIGPMRYLVDTGLIKYPVPRVDHRFKDRAKIRLGPIELTAHVTGGHTRGATTWSFPVRDGDRELLAVSMGKMAPPSGGSLEPESYPGILTDYEKNFQKLRSLPTDIFLSSDARYFSMRRKLRERKTAEDPVAPFIDRDGYLNYINRAEERFREVLKEQQQAP